MVSKLTTFLWPAHPTGAILYCRIGIVAFILDTGEIDAGQAIGKTTVGTVKSGALLLGRAAGIALPSGQVHRRYGESKRRVRRLRISLTGAEVMTIKRNAGTTAVARIRIDMACIFAGELFLVIAS
jgi:hypothetical protein